MKNFLFEYLNAQLKGPREEYERLLDAPDYVESVLQRGAARAREASSPFMDDIRRAVGFRTLG